MSKKLAKPNDTKRYTKYNPPEEIVDTDVSIAIAGSVDAGKCFGKGTMIMLYDGTSKPVENICTGDVLMGDDSTKRTVLEVHSGISELFQINLGDGTKHVVNGEHVLCLRHNNECLKISVKSFLKINEKEEYTWYRTGVAHYNGTVDTRIEMIDRLVLCKGSFEGDICSVKVTKKEKNDVIRIIRSLALTILICEDKNEQCNIKFIYEKNKINVHSHVEYNFTIESIGKGMYYGFETDGNHKFLLDDFSVVHNSSLVGVLFSGELDNGNGSARNYVARHQHEIDTGRTSDVSSRSLYCGNGKSVTLIDLCGHEKYLKTTLCGITGQFPDYAVVVVASNRGILKMTKEHLGILFYMQIPVIIVISRADMAPVDTYNKTIKGIKTMCNTYNKSFDILNGLPQSETSPQELTPDLLEKCNTVANNLNKTTDYIPVITISNKTGYYVDVLKNILFNLKPRRLWENPDMSESVFYIDSVFNPAGIGIVLSGILKGKSVKSGDILYLGPLSQNFMQLRVKSIHNNFRQSVNQLNDHQRGCFSVTPVNTKQELTRDMINRGMLIISNESMIKNVCYRFKAEIQILHHSATIGLGYSPVIHSGSIRQSARVVGIEKIVQRGIDVDLSTTKNPSIKTGEKALVEFKFKYKPEFLETETTFFFREGSTRGVGVIKYITSVSDDTTSGPDVHKVKRKYKKKL